MAPRAVLDTRKLSWMLLASVVLYNEILSYYINSLGWPAREAGAAITILLVADPQLQGIRDEPRFPMGAVTRWDSDRYLRTTFAYAAANYRPDAVLFLGDLIDEGEMKGNFLCILD